MLAAAFMIVLVAVVAAGLSGRGGAGASPSNAAIGPTDAVTDAPTPGQSAFDRPFVPAPPGRGLPSFAAGAAPVYTSEPGPLEIQAERHPETIFVHGDVDAARITWVFVSVQDEVGRVAGWTSVSVPGEAGPNKQGGPALRFDTELPIPDDFGGRLFVRAQAYDATGRIIASTSVEIPAAIS